MNYKFVLGYLIVVLINFTGCDFSEKDWIKDVKGKPIHINGKWLVINYWATWCAPCVHEMPELNEINKISNVQVIGINFDHLKNEALGKAIEDLNITFPITNDALDKHYQYLLPIALPMTVIISPKGDLIKVLHGPQKQEDILKHTKNNHRI